MVLPKLILKPLTSLDSSLNFKRQSSSFSSKFVFRFSTCQDIKKISNIKDSKQKFVHYAKYRMQ